LPGIQGLGCQRIFSKTRIIGFQTGTIELDFFDKQVTGGFTDIKLEPMLTIMFSTVI